MPMAALFDCCSELAGVIKEKKAALPPADAEGNRPKTALDGEIAALEAVSATAAWQCCCLGRYSVGSAHSDAAENMACHFRAAHELQCGKVGQLLLHGPGLDCPSPRPCGARSFQRPHGSSLCGKPNPGVSCCRSARS